MTQTVPDISPLMPMHQDPLLVSTFGATDSADHGAIIVVDYIMAGHAIVGVKDINLLFYHGNAVILTLR